jgi:RNA polymerase sigma-70 factor (ECF subfamily)
MEESKAIALLRRRDVGGLEPLVRKYQAQAVQAAYLITHDRPLAEDVVQTAFLRVLDRIDGYDVNRPFRPWFMRIVVNAAIDTARRAARTPFDSNDNLPDSALLELVPDPAPGPEDAAVSSELRQAMHSALDVLPPAQRAAIVMRYYLGLDEAEMAGEMAVPEGTVKWRLHAARVRLRGLLANRKAGRRQV